MSLPVVLTRQAAKEFPGAQQFVRPNERDGWPGQRGAQLHVPRWAARRFRGTWAFRPPLPRPPQVSHIRAQSVGRHEEFDTAADWYEEQDELGAKFTACVRAVLEQIAQMPESRAIIYRDIRRAGVRRFPYNVFYRVHVDRVEVIAVLHGRRAPSVWKSRA